MTVVCERGVSHRHVPLFCERSFAEIQNLNFVQPHAYGRLLIVLHRVCVWLPQEGCQNDQAIRTRTRNAKKSSLLYVICVGPTVFYVLLNHLLFKTAHAEDNMSHSLIMKNCSFRVLFYFCTLLRRDIQYSNVLLLVKELLTSKKVHYVFVTANCR